MDLDFAKSALRETADIVHLNDNDRAACALIAVQATLDLEVLWHLEILARAVCSFVSRSSLRPLLQLRISNVHTCRVGSRKSRGRNGARPDKPGHDGTWHYWNR